MVFEEKKAIEHLRNYPTNWLFDDVNESAIKIVLNLIEKQAKEIENLENKNEKLESELIVYKIYTKQDDLKDYDLFLKQFYVNKEEAEQQIKEAYIKGTNVADELCNKKWEDKIKAKIEEIKEEIKTCNIYTRIKCCTNKCKEDCEYYNFIDILQSLLKEKE